MIPDEQSLTGDQLEYVRWLEEVRRVADLLIDGGTLAWDRHKIGSVAFAYITTVAARDDLASVLADDPTLR